MRTQEVLRGRKGEGSMDCICLGLKNYRESEVETVGKKDRRQWLRHVILGFAIVKASTY